jgi:DNA-binding NtrC family response regulator
MTAFSTKYGLPPKRLHPDTLAWIRNHHWPGNIRELENLIHRELLQAGGDEIIFRGDAPRWGAGLGEDGEREACPDFHTAKACAIAAFERAYLTRMLTEAHGNVTLAARNACQERRAFGRLLKKHRIDPNQFRT